MGKSLWTFRGYTTDAGNQIVQEWFDSLLLEDRELLRDRINYLSNIERHLWIRPSFDKLDDDLNEVRRGSIRIYGYFPSDRHVFVFLNGVHKDTSNDRSGKSVALKRLKLLRRGIGGTHEFDFEEKLDQED